MTWIIFDCVGADYNVYLTWYLPNVCSLRPMTCDRYAKCPMFDTYDTEVR